MGCISKGLARFIVFGLLSATVQLFVMSNALAQQARNGSRLLGADGTLTPDFQRSQPANPQDELDPFDGQTTALPVARPEPQDPLNQVYASRASREIDRQNDESLNNPARTGVEGLLPMPLNEAPRNFRDDRFLQGLARQARQNKDAAGNGDWRTRDDAAFDPLGIRAGSFVFYPELYSRLITSNNLFATKANRKSDAGLEITPTLRLQSDWNNHEFEFFATGTSKRWHNFSSENTLEYETRARGRIDITSRASIEAGARYQLKAEGRGSVELSDAASGPADAHEIELFGQANYRFNRLGFRVRGQVIRNIYENVALKGGGVQDNHLRDYDDMILALRTNYEFSPRFSAFVDTELGRRKFQHRLDSGGFVQGSDRWLAAVGASVEFTSNLRALARIGYAKATPDDARLSDLAGVIYDASLIWTPTRLMTVTLNGQTELEETTQTGSLGSLKHSVSLELMNSWTHRLSTTLTSSYSLNDYAGIDQKDTEWTFGLAAEYLFSRSWVVDAGYEYKRVKGSNTYKEDKFHMGLKWRR